MTYPTRLKLNCITVVALVIALLLVAIAFPLPVAANPAIIPASPPGGQENPGGAESPDYNGDGDTGDTWALETPETLETPARETLEALEAHGDTGTWRHGTWRHGNGDTGQWRHRRPGNTGHTGPT